MSEPQISDTEIIAELWRRGDLSWKLRSNQADVRLRFYQHDQAYFFWTMNRQGGKSYTLCNIAGEAGLHGLRVFYGAHSQKATRGIVRPALASIFADCPADLRPEFRVQEGEYGFPGGGLITVGGLDDERAEDWRGRTYDLVLVDEGGFISDLRYKVESVLFPMTKTTRGRILIASTPPKTPGHDYVGFALQCEAEGGHIRKTIYDDPSVTPDVLRGIIRACGGEDSVAFRREHLCEFLVDPDFAVIPEFTDAKKDVIVREFEVPRYFHPTVGMDPGMIDRTFIVFGYYDFQRGVHCVQDEYMARAPRTSDIATAIRNTEARLWGKRPVYSRVSDIDHRLITDLSVEHGMDFSPTAKDNKEAQINALRMVVAENRLEIHPRCVNLIRQLRTATWNSNRSTFERTDTDGHFDGIDALVYWLRAQPVHDNPYPALPDGVQHGTHFIPPGLERSPTDAGAVLGKALFRRRSG